MSDLIDWQASHALAIEQRDALAAELASIRQWEAWAKPQIMVHMTDQARIAALEAALRDCWEDLTHCTPQGRRTWERAKAMTTSETEGQPDVHD